jgi:Xaa-Pro dipeptidase
VPGQTHDRAIDTANADAPGLGAAITHKVRAAMDSSRLDAVLVTSPENLAYAAGAVPPSLKTVRSRLAGLLIPREGSTEAVVVALEGPLMRGVSRAEKVSTYREFAEHPMAKMAESLSRRGLGDGRIGIEETHLPVTAHRVLEQSLPAAALVPVDDLLAGLRSIKSPAEISLIRDIGAAAQRLAEDCVRQVRAGATEVELGSLIADGYALAGGDELTMLVVGSGERSAHPNAPPTHKVMARGEIVRLDVIGTKSNYYSDVARTAVVGEPTTEQQRVYDLLLDVHERSLEALKPGVQTSDVYRLYSEAMEGAGLPAYHFLGHGLGVTLHEEPFINNLRSVPLEPNMVLCIEPLTMIEGRFGMQIEDEVLITSDGCEPLTRVGDMLRIEG